MANLQVADVNVPGIIKKLKTWEWLSPLFQRDFVWSNAAVVSLINSIIDARPVGMITLWEQEGDSSLPLEPISIPDYVSEKGKTAQRFFGDEQTRPGRFYAILDGRQRSTALALAFGGLRASSGLYRNAGRYFLDVCASDDAERVKFISEKDVSRRGLDVVKTAIANGLFPLEVSNPDEIFDQWMSYLQQLRDPSCYPNNMLPDDTELERRNRILRKAFDGIIKTKIALYIVPQDYDLAEICDIFETLNTTGTKVSTVDLIHSNIYADTVNDSIGSVIIRDEIDILGEHEGAIGWASSRDRPELIAQVAAAVHVSLDTKPEPRPIGSKRDMRISSVKSQDLLALPAQHWRNFFGENAQVAGFLGAFQQAVAGGSFGMNQCPYPASASIYVGLRWFHQFDRGATEWDTQHLDSLYRAFFWRNSMLTRYDQGFLTQIGTDIKEIKSFLSAVRTSTNFESWRAHANIWLDEYLGQPCDFETAFDIVTDGSEAGALRKASHLLLYSRASFDVVETTTSIRYGTADLQLHHIFPKDWCANNQTGDARAYLDKESSKKDWANSAANLMPMCRATNLKWRKKSPGQFINESDLNYDSRSSLWNAYFIDRIGYEILESDASNIGEFWTRRGKMIAEEICRRMQV